MFEDIRRAWHFTKVSFGVIRADPEILALPLFAGVVLAAVLAAGWFGVVGPILAGPIVPGMLLLLAILALYILGYFVVIWFNAAVIEMATIRFNGGDPVVMDGLRKAGSRSHRIFQWAIIAGTVGLLLDILNAIARDRQNIIGQIITSMIGTAWKVLSAFALPVAIYRDVGPIQALKGSGAMVKRTFGTSVTSIVGIGFLFSLLAAPGGILIWLTIENGLSPIFAVVGVVYSLAVTALAVAINGILVAALYKFANEGTLPQVYSQAGISASDAAW